MRLVSLYSFAVVVLSAALVTLAGAAVVAGDPEARLSRDRLAYAPDYISKPIVMESYPYHTLLIGSSRFMEINPDEIKGYDAYNGGFGGITPENMLELLDLHAKAGQIVVIGLDLYMMNEFHTPLQSERWINEKKDKSLIGKVLRLASPPSFLARRLIDEREYALNIGTLARTLAGQHAGINADGSRVPVTYPNGQIFNANKLIVDHVCGRPVKPPSCAQGFQKGYDEVMQGHFARFDYSAARVETFRKMRRLLDQRGVRYVVLINPEHDAFWPTVHGARLDAISRRFKTDVASSFEHVCDYFDEAHKEPSIYYNTDPFHYLPAAGANMVNECLHRFGVAP